MLRSMHALRHFYVSTLLDGGESIKALSEYLGHHDAGFTLRTYTHLMPSSQARTINTVSAVFEAATHNSLTAHRRPRRTSGPLAYGLRPR
jgi:site-specific recombinase XerC